MQALVGHWFGPRGSPGCPARLVPRPSTGPHPTPWEPPTWPDPPTSRQYRMGLDPPSGDLGFPPPAPASRARCHAQAKGGGAAPGPARWGHHLRWRHGNATRMQGCAALCPRRAHIFGDREPGGPALPQTRPRRTPRCTCMRWRPTVPRGVGLPVLARRPRRGGRVAWPGKGPRWRCLPQPWVPNTAPQPRPEAAAQRRL